MRGRFPARDHDRHSASYVAHLRALSSGHGEDAEVRALVAALSTESPEFAALWERHDVQPRSRMRKDVVHPELGVLAMDCHVLRSEDERQMLLVFTPAD